MVMETLFSNEEKNIRKKKLHEGDDFQAELGKSMFKIMKT